MFLSFICNIAPINIRSNMENNYRPSNSDSSRYWGMLKDLSDAEKIELIALLSNSVAHKTPVPHDEDWATQ